MTPHVLARGIFPTGMALALLLSVHATAAEAPPSGPTAAERKRLDALAARVLEKDFKLVPIRTASGGWRVGLAVRGYTKTETETGGVKVDPFWSTEWAQELGSWKDLRIRAEVGDGFCGGQGRSFLVTVSSRSGTRIKTYGVFAGEPLAKLDYMDGDTCME